LLTADFYHRASILARVRDFAAESDHSNLAPAPWDIPNTATSATAAGVFNSRSATTEYGNFLLGTVTATDQYGNVTGFASTRPAGVPATLASATGLFVLQPNGGNSVVFGTAAPPRAGVTHDWYWNNNVFRVIQPKSNRTNVFLSTEYDLTDKVSAFVDASLYRAESPHVPRAGRHHAKHRWFQSSCPSPIPTIRSATASGPRRVRPMPTARRDSPALRPPCRLPQAPHRSHAPQRLGGRLHLPRVAGLRGKLFRTWSWEAALLYTTARVIDDEQGPDRKSRLIAAINQSESGQGVQSLHPLVAVQNGTLVVTGPYTNPDSVTSTFRSSFADNGLTKLGSGDFRASGDLWPLWGGNSIGGAFGGEFRYEAYDRFRAPFAGINPPGSGLDPESNDYLGFGALTDTHGQPPRRRTLRRGRRATRRAREEISARAIARALRFRALRELHRLRRHDQTEIRRRLEAVFVDDGARVVQRGFSRAKSRAALLRRAQEHGDRQHGYLSQHGHRFHDRWAVEPPPDFAGQSPAQARDLHGQIGGRRDRRAACQRPFGLSRLL